VSSKEFNKAFGMTYLCPITSKKRNFASHICFVGKDLSGFVMVEQLRSVDWKKRKIKFIKKAEKELVLNVKNCLEAILN
jgi:mRNA interferase MazF